MGRAPTIPASLTRGPFTLSDAEHAGLTRWHLKGQSWRHVGLNLYLYAGLKQTPAVRLQVALRRLPPGSVFSGETAAWLHGLESKLAEPIEVSVASGCAVWARAGLTVRRTAVTVDETVAVRGFPTTSVLTTMRDRRARLSRIEAITDVDAALRAR